MQSTHKDLRISNFAYKVKGFLEVASEVANDVINLRDNPRPVDYMSVATKLSMYVLEKYQNEFYDYFEDWYSLEGDALSDIIIRALLKLPTKTVGGADHHQLMISNVYGCEIGWVKHKQIDEKTSDIDHNNDYSGPYIMTQYMKESFDAISKLLWDSLESQHAVFGTKPNVKAGVVSDKSRVIGLYSDVDISQNVFASKRAIEMTDRVLNFVKHDVNRSVLLLGPPGTGKTTMMKYCAAQLNMKSLRLNVADLDQFNSDILVSVIDVLKPECLIIDDFDRLHSSSANSMLTQLEQLNKVVKVMLVSVNNIQELDPAIIRPGRFDEILEIRDIDQEVILKLLDDDLPDSIRKELMKWPVAYINEFAKRKHVLGLEQALNEVSELKHRIEKINNRNYKSMIYDDELEDVDQ